MSTDDMMERGGMLDRCKDQPAVISGELGGGTGPQLTIQDPLNASDCSREQLPTQVIDLLDDRSVC